ncbi:Translin [Epithele typhae]|uniref:Translin n=1 Tax=Epithele typhae TaxID=378194 RepID=UPI00200755F4|nr:Translin [Epithele typhae]KAH9921999.1 Translin [Epithele typhae]
MPPSSTIHSRDAVLSAFDHFREELDEHNDLRETLIKASRDVTNLSKKLIFLLHRTMTEDAVERDNRVLGCRAASRARPKLEEIRKLFADMRPHLDGERFSRYHRNVSPGLQELVEALSFAHYLEHGTLISYREVQNYLSDDDRNPYFPLPLEDYLLGLSDLTGELMRHAIASISQRGGRQRASEVCEFVRSCKADFEVFTPQFKELRKKQFVTNQSLEKIENATYAIAVRTSEYDLPPEMLEDLVRQMVSQASDARDLGERGVDHKHWRPSESSMEVYHR